MSTLKAIQHTDPTTCVQSCRSCQLLCLFHSAVQTTLPSSQLGFQAADSKQVHLCQTCHSHRFIFQKNFIVLGSVAAFALPSNPSIDDLSSRNSNTDLESFACSIVLKTSHRPPCSFPFASGVFSFPLEVGRPFHCPNHHLCHLETSKLDLGATYPLPSA